MRGRLLKAFSLVPGAVADVRFPADIDEQLRQRRQRNLPRRLDSFSGRGAELEAMRDALSDASVLRTWWVTGPGGIVSRNTSVPFKYAIAPSSRIRLMARSRIRAGSFTTNVVRK